MPDWVVRITCIGWFTCDAYFECPERGRIECPDFETIEELAKWISENVDCY